MRVTLRFAALWFLLMAALAGAVLYGQVHALPVLRKTGQVTELMVDGKPFLALAGELHNSTPSNAAYMRPVFDRLAELHLNTVIGAASWELVEPEEGHFDFALVDAQLDDARNHNMHLVLIWFGTWKNTSSTYVPYWVKTNPQRFHWAEQLVSPTPEHPKRGLYALSAFDPATEAADAKAFAALMAHLRDADKQHTVIMMQVENETGILTEPREYSPLALKAWNAQVPRELIDYLVANKAALLPEVASVWEGHGAKTSGTWADVFGDDAYGGEIFMAWHLGRYIQAVAAAGKKELALPMYVNAWLMPNETSTPGDYPSGGPVSRVMDIWRAAAPAIDLYAPDIYPDHYDPILTGFARLGNPLFIPEARDNPGNLLWAIANYHAMGVSPFGIDDVKPGDPLGVMYGELSGAIPVIEKAETDGKIAGIPEANKGTFTTTVGGMNFKVDYVSTSISQTVVKHTPGQPDEVVVLPDVVATTRALAAGQMGYGMIVAGTPGEFYLFGKGVTITFVTPGTGPDNTVIAECDEGYFDAGKWVQGRTLEGDERSKGLRGVVMPANLFVVRRVRVYKHDAPGWQ